MASLRNGRASLRPVHNVLPRAAIATAVVRNHHVHHAPAHLIPYNPTTLLCITPRSMYHGGTVMNEEPATSRAPGDSPAVSKDLLLELNFVPEWARREVTANPYVDRWSEGRSTETPRRDRHDRRGRGAPRGKPRDGRGGGGRPRPERGDGRDRGRERDRRQGGRPSRAPALPIKVSFLADRAHIGTLVREIRRSGKAYPLVDIASLIMQKAEHYLVKLEITGGEKAAGVEFHQCKVCKAVFLHRDALAQHIARQHLDEVFEIREIEGEAPRGNFMVVCRCGLSGVLLGPPNYHGYQAKIQEVLHARYPDMPMERYRSHIQTLRDPELIEQWKNESRTQRVYVRRGGPDDETLTFEQVRQEFVRDHVASRMSTSRRVILPATVAQHLEDAALLQLIREAWAHEIRFPLSLAFTLRPAFRHMGLHLFKANRKANFVIPAEPKPLDPEHAIPEIAALLRHLHDHPGCTREALLHDLHPGATEEAPEVVELNKNLRWLIEKGHVIHFYTGALSVPTSSHRADSRPMPPPEAARRGAAAKERAPHTRGE